MKKREKRKEKKKRQKAKKLALKQFEALEDAFQHFKVNPEVEIS
jgi:hypothetical protein